MVAAFSRISSPLYLSHHVHLDGADVSCEPVATHYWDYHLGAALLQRAMNTPVGSSQSEDLTCKYFGLRWVKNMDFSGIWVRHL